MSGCPDVHRVGLMNHRREGQKERRHTGHNGDLAIESTHVDAEIFRSIT
jgi:hypothetical protein